MDIHVNGVLKNVGVLSKTEEFFNIFLRPTVLSSFEYVNPNEKLFI